MVLIALDGGQLDQKAFASNKVFMSEADCQKEVDGAIPLFDRDVEAGKLGGYVLKCVQVELRPPLPTKKEKKK